MLGALYFLCFAVLLPCEMLIWAYALDRSLANSYLARRVSLSIFMEIPQLLLLGLAILTLVCILRACLSLGKGSHAKDGTLYAGFVTLTGVLFLYFRLPCSFALIVPLLITACTAAWYSSPSSTLREDFLLPKDMYRTASLAERLRAFHQLLAIQCASCLLFQGGYQLWFVFPWTSFIGFIPFAGLVLRTSGKLRQYINSSFGALVLCALLYGSSQFFLDDIPLSELSIFFAVLFVVLQFMLLLKQWIGNSLQNLSILLMLPAAGLSYMILIPICSFLIVPFCAYIFYILIDNAPSIRRFLFSFAHKRTRRWNILSDDEYKAAAWGCGAVLTAFLLGPDKLKVILICTGVLLAGSLLRARFLSNRQEDHIILKNFPYIVEVILLGTALLILCPARKDLVISLCAFSCGAALMQWIWHTGRIIRNKSNEQEGPLVMIYLAASWGVLSIIMILLFFWQLPACLYFGIYLILAGLIRVGESACSARDEDRRSTAGWVLVILGQFMTVTSPEIVLPVPEWYDAASLCGFLAFASLYVFRLLDSRNRNKDTLS